MAASCRDGKDIRRKILPGWAIVFLVFIFQDCTYTLEKPPQQKSINLISPVDRLVTVNTTQSFSWGAVDGATYYQLQIASPDFTSASSIVTDTAMTSTTYSRVLGLGKYRWCVHAVNSSYVTIYSDTNVLTVH